MFSMCSELTPRARILDTRIPQFMQPCPCRCKTFTYFIFRLTITFKWLRVDELRYPEQLALATLIFLISFSTMLLLYLVYKVFQECVLLFYIVATPLKILGRFFGNIILFLVVSQSSQSYYLKWFTVWVQPFTCIHLPKTLPQQKVLKHIKGLLVKNRRT